MVGNGVSYGAGDAGRSAVTALSNATKDVFHPNAVTAAFGVASSTTYSCLMNGSGINAGVKPEASSMGSNLTPPNDNRKNSGNDHNNVNLQGATQQHETQREFNQHTSFQHSVGDFATSVKNFVAGFFYKEVIAPHTPPPAHEKSPEINLMDL